MLVELLRNQPPKRGVEFGTREGETTATLLKSFKSLHLISVDTYLAVPWITKGHTQQDKNEQKATAIAAVNRFASRCTLWHIEALAAARTLEGLGADFVYVDLKYSHWPMHFEAFPKILRSGGLLCGGGCQQRRFRKYLQNLFDLKSDMDSGFWYTLLK